jgi:primosomal protein N' (replication factor Y)
LVNASRPRPERPEPAAENPVARLCVDIPLAHLDRPFDYLVPASLADEVVPGSRVRVRFAGKLVDAFVLERGTDTEHTGRLSFVDKSVSAEPVLSPEIGALARAVADRWAGSLIDVLRLAIPPRHARVEAEEPAEPPSDPVPAPEPGNWSRYTAGSAFLRAVGAGRPARAVWSALPGEDWPARIAAAVQATLAAGRGAVVVVPDHRDLDRVDAALTAALGSGRHATLAAELGPAKRYRSWLSVRRGGVRAVVGTRGAVFAPVQDVGLLVLWDDGDDLHAEPRSPYPHARDVLILRAHSAGAALLLAGHARTAEAQQLVQSGWAHEIVAERAEVRRAAPRVVPTGDDFEVARDAAARSARLPTLAWRIASDSLKRGAPVLVQVPRRGYVPSLACARCRAPARCAALIGPAPEASLRTVCQGPLSSTSGHAVPTCRWCGAIAGRWQCTVCGGDRLRAVIVGAGRTAEELGRAFTGFPIRRSGGDSVLAEVSGEPALVVATPGAEPVAEGGYGAALLLDAWALLTRPDLRAAEETLRRWANAAALLQPAAAGGTVVVVADGGLAVVQALLRWDPAGYAARELAERAELGFPPTSRMASLTGTSTAIADFLAGARLPEQLEQLGPVPVSEESERLLLRVSRSDGLALARGLHAAAGVRSARKAPDPVRVQLDPAELG